MMLDTILCGDCMELLKGIPDKSIDLVVTDPPYEFCNGGSGGCFGIEKRSYHKELHGIDKGITDAVLAELERVMKVLNIYLFCNKNQIRQYLNFFSDYNMDLLTWHKLNPVPTCNNKYLSDTEYVLFFRDKGAHFQGEYTSLKKYWLTETNKKDKDIYGHPTIKPLSIIKTLVSNSSEVGGVILDPFCGSGTTCVAAAQLGRHYIGMEIDPKYHKTACERVKDELSQLTLF